MKTKFLLALLISATSILSACGGGKKTKAASTDKSSDVDVNNTPDNNTPTIAALDAYAGSSLLGHGESTSITVIGGSGSYSFSVTSGSGTVTSSGYYTAPNTDGFASIQVLDNYSYDSVTISIEITSSSSTVGCTELGSTSVVKSDPEIERSIDLTKYSQLSGYVIIGVGFRILDSDVKAIYTKVARLLGSGEIDMNDTYTYRSGDLGNTGKGELYIQLPSNYMLYGVGMAVESTGQDLEIMKLYGARLDGTTGEITNTTECYFDRHGNSGCSNSTGTPSAAGYNQYVGEPSRPLVGFGFGVKVNKVTAVWAKQQTLVFNQSGGCSN